MPPLRILLAAAFAFAPSAWAWASASSSSSAFFVVPLPSASSSFPPRGPTAGATASRSSSRRTPTTRSSSSILPLRSSSSSFRSSSSSSEYDEGGGGDCDDNLKTLRDRATNAALLERLFAPDSVDGDMSLWSAENVEAGVAQRCLVDLELAGRGSMSVFRGKDEDGSEEEGETKDKKAAVPCLFLASPSDCRSIRAAYKGEDPKDEATAALFAAAAADSDSASALPVPLPSASSYSRALRLLSFAYDSRPISKSLCLTLNPLLTNRDGGLWDNLPWSEWSVDPLVRNRDAADNPIERKYHLGKRDAYNRMMGKDWPGRSLSLTNLVAKAIYLLEGDDDDDDNDDDAVEANFDEDAARILARRVLELEVREARSALAEAEQYLAMLRAQYGLGLDAAPSTSTSGETDYGEADHDDDDGGSNDDMDDDLLLWSLPDNSDRWTVQGAMDDAAGARARVKEAEAAIETLNAAADEGADPRGGDEVRSVLRQFLSYLTDNQGPDAPYRGAIGYAPVLDSREEMFTKSILPYAGPYDLLAEIIEEQLNADVIGCVVENTSLFDGRLTLGGAVVLRRRGVKKTIRVEGTTLELDDEDDELGNAGLTGGTTYVVECDADEAVGVALAAGLPVSVERAAWEGARIGAGLAPPGAETTTEKSVLECIPSVEPRGGDDASTGSPSASAGGPSDDRLTPEAPQSDDDAFADFFRPKPEGTSMFPTDNPVTSLGQYDALTVQDKARILLSLDSFKGRLPRPRALRNTNSRRPEASSGSSSSSTKGGGGGGGGGATLDPLDELLVPLVDESVRRRILIRDAEARDDADEAQRLREGVSRRQRAKERAEKATEAGADETVAEMYEEEADFQGELRADVTQDEGAYSRFLDKDEWYERDRLARAKRIDKKKFGTLLDGTGLE